MRLHRLPRVGLVLPAALIAALAGPVLGERVGPWRWAAVALGFLGVVAVLRPGLATFQPAAVFAVAGQLAYVAYQLLARRLRGEANAVDLTLQSALVGTAMTAVAMPFVWTAPDALDWVMLIGFALLQAAGQWTLAAALQRAATVASKTGT